VGWSAEKLSHHPDRSVTVHLNPDGELRVWFDPAVRGRAVSVQLSIAEGVTPTVLHRFPFKQFLDQADAAQRLLPLSMPSRRFTRLESMAAPTTARPGRRGHAESFYAGIAERYNQLLSKGARNPTATIAAERFVSRSTAAGWISQARRREYLPPAQRGRPG
jgi:hypothetical protein